MFGGKRATDAETHAIAAWNELTEALGSTRDSATDRAKGLSNEAGRRINAAWGVLAGRPAPVRTWPVIGGIALGLAVGWVASEIVRRRRPQIDRAMEAVGEELKHTKESIDGRIDRAKAAVNSSTAR